MIEAQRVVDFIRSPSGQGNSLDDLLAETCPLLPDLVHQRDGLTARWTVRKHRVYRFADDSLADLSHVVPRYSDGEVPDPQCDGKVVYAVVRQAVDYLTADERHGIGLPDQQDPRQPVDHTTEWALQYGREGEERVEIIGTGAHAERLARTWHAKQSTPDQLAQTSWQRLTLVARDIYLAPWRTIDTPTTGTESDQPSTTSAPQATGQK